MTLFRIGTDHMQYPLFNDLLGPKAKKVLIA